MAAGYVKVNIRLLRLFAKIV